MSEAWPPQLKDWVAKCLGQITDSNKEQVQAELKQVIGEAFTNKTLWTTDWNGVQLQSLMPKLPLQQQLKRKLRDKHIANKKKKPGNKNHSTYSNIPDVNDQAALNRRAERFQREHEIERQKLHGGQGSSQVTAHSNLIHRIQSNSRSGSPASWGNEAPEGNDRSVDWDRYSIVGTSQQLFKDYLRLTTEPDPKDIRPYRVLEKTLIELKKRWRQNNDYPWICNQFKSIRQDLIVQRINNEFTVQVYEIHARMALEAADMVEYNQCQQMLKNLYEMGIRGCNDEFTAYRILLLLHGMNRSELNLLVGRLTGKQKQQSAIKHALEVQRAMSTNNYHAFFEYYSNSPNMGAYIMDHFVDRERTKALMVISKAYIQLPIAFIQDELAFENAAQAATFITQHRAAFYQNPDAADEQKVLDCRPAQLPLAKVFDEKYRKATIKGAI
ncbi:SAC3/GANP/Nin1/mts3/eIF-3 p25 family-domain-containing protein [Phellopilus nigrolimitatus]|nr:SAC3/GANP/Nin1/mts3/eIF-3 p25 family-domain-containing protein [Phellopilus nigrolimitatus]